MSLDACAANVARADPDRFRAAMLAPLDVRGDLMALYAFNLEVARAPWVTAEPLIAEMRIQFWADVLEETFGGGPVRPHEVATPFAEAVRRRGLPRAPLDALLAARREDVGGEAPADRAALLAYLDATAGGLMALAARVASGGGAAEDAARALGQGQGAAAYLVALPALRAAGRAALPPGEAEGEVRALARAGLDRLRDGRAGRRSVPRAAAPALLAAHGADAVLRVARAAPARALEGRLLPSEFRRRLGFAAASLSGRW